MKEVSNVASIEDVDKDTREDFPDGIVGEVLLERDLVMLAHINVAYELRIVDAEGWLEIGDAGYIGARDRCIYLVDGYAQSTHRALWFAEVEKILRENEVWEETVVNDTPHRENGEAPTAFLTG